MIFLTSMRVIAIDPGYDRLGVSVMEHWPGGEKLIFSDCITTDKTLPLSERINTIGSELTSLLEKHSPDALAIETLFFNKNVKTALGVAQARGVIIFIATQAKMRVYEFSPQEIKIATTGYGNSDKNAMIEMVKRLVPNAPTKALDDEYDAIAVGITCLAHHRN